MGLLQKGKVQEAALELRNALQIDPRFAEAATTLAEISFRQGNYPEAFRLLQQAEASKPDYMPARKGMAQMYRLSGKLAEAEAEADYILEHSPDDIDELMNLSAIQTAQKKYADAEGTLNRILEIQPSNVPALMTLATLKQNLHDAPAAERFLKMAIDKNPRSITAYLGLIKFYLVSGRGKDADPLFERALKIGINRTEVLQAQLGYLEGAKRAADAEEVARKIQVLNAGDSKYWTVLADFFVRGNEWGKAKAELERTLQEHKDDPTATHKLVEVLLDLGDRKAAEALNEAALKRNAKDSIAHLFKGRFYLLDHVIDKALAEFNETQKYQPNLPSLHYWYAQAYWQQGDLARAQQSLDTALKYDPNYVTARRDLAELQARTGGVEAGLANARSVLQANPTDTRAILAYSQVLITKKNFGEAEKVLKAAAQRASNDPDYHRQMGILALSKKDLTGARSEFSNAWKLQPHSRALLDGVLMCYVAASQVDGALDFIKKQLEGNPNDALLYYELGQVYLLQNKRAEAIAALKKAEGADPSGVDSSFLLASTYAASTADRDGAAAVVNRLAKQHPQDPGVLLRAASVLESTQRWEEARQMYERALQIDTGNAIAKNNLAWLLVEHGGNIDVALGLAQQAKEKLVDNLQVTSTIGWIYYKKSAYKSALTYLKECADKDQKNPTFQYQLGMTYSKLGETAAAKRLLMNALALDSRFPNAKAAREALAGL